MKEPEVTNLRSPESIREPDKPFLDNRDMVVILCIICAVLITYLMFNAGWIPFYGIIQFGGTFILLILAVFVILFWTTQKIVKTCYIRAKRKATDKVSD